MNRWVLVCLFAWLPLLATAQVSPAPGTYASPLEVNLKVPEATSARYRFLESSSAAWSDWTGPLSLEALPGESRRYGLRVLLETRTGESQTKDFSFVVVGASNPIPTIQPEPGTYFSAIAVRPSLPPGWKITENGRITSFPRTLDASPGKTVTSLFDAVGPSGTRLTWSYTVDRRDQEALSLELLSPVEGEWANAQTLVASFRGVDRVLWSYGDHIDPLSAREYSAPVLLEREGRQTVTIAARSRADGGWISRQVRWDNGTLAGPAPDWPSSGASSTGLHLPSVPGALVSWDDGHSWRTAEEATTEESSLTSRKVLTVQVKQAGTLHRSVYWLDARAPESPKLEFIGGWNPRVVFSGTQEALHRVTWTLDDGRSLDAPEQLWGPSGSWKVPDQVVAARVEAVGINGLVSAPISIGFAQTGWSTPTWEPWDQTGPLADQSVLPLGGRVLPRPGFWPVFEVSDQPDVLEPNVNSPLLEGAFVPTFPPGSDRTLYVRFAWRDAGGLVGPGSRAVAVRTDRVPPPVPDVSTTGGQVLVRAAEGEEEGGALLWVVTKERVASDDALAFQPYAGVLTTDSLRDGAKGGLWLHARAVDRAGNSGPSRLNVALPAATEVSAALVQVDADPSVGDRPVENGGVYPWPSFRLRALDQSRDLWVAVSDSQGGVPADWRTRLQPWKGLLSRGVARGERRTFVVYWNAKTADGWVWAEPQALRLTLDLSAPALPAVPADWPTAPLGGPWTLSLKPARSGDSLWFTESLDGSLPGDPVLGGQPWPGARTWDTLPLTQTTVRVRVAAVSVSGTRLEVPLGSPVVLDRRVPPPVSPRLEPFTYRTEAVTVPPPEVTGVLIRYTVTTDGQLPEIPTGTSSPLPGRGLVLEGREGESVLYRLRWRPFSAAGIPGPATDAYGVLVDRSISTRSPSTSAVSTKVLAPQILGLPAGGISSAPVTLTLSGAAALVRYELREGVGSPRPVSAESPVWPGTLVVDGGEGVDRSFALAVRAFAPDGTPVTEEVLARLRIDRSAPLAPLVDLVGDTRRPEVRLRGQSSTGSPEEVLHYRWVWDAFGASRGSSDWQTLGNAPAVFAAPNGALTRLTAQAYLTDRAGNRGPIVEQSFLVDQNVVYVASKGSGTGTRSEPVSDLGGALERARREGKSVLLVANGTYPVTKTLDLSGMTIYGGLSAAQWESTAEVGRSLITVSAPFDGDSVVVSGPAAWTVSHLDLSTSGLSVASLVSVKGAKVVLSNATWTWSGAQHGWDQEGGAIDWTNVSLVSGVQPLGSVLDWRGLEAQVRMLRLSATGNQGGQIVSLTDSTALFQDLVLVSKRASGFDGLWSAVRSTLTVDQARVQAGDGADRATAFVFKDSDASFWNSEISLYAGASNTGFQVSKGRFELQKSALSLLAGQEFNQGFVLDQADTRLRSFELKVESGAYQGGFSIEGGAVAMASSKIRLAGGGNQVWGAQFLSPALVTFQDVSWSLAKKTTGELWMRRADWKSGSSATGQVTGW